MSGIPSDASVAVALHKLSAAVKAVERADTWASGRGIDPADLRRALDLLTTTADAAADRENRLGRILTAIRAPNVLVEECEVVERIRDETVEERQDRLFREGYVAAILGNTGAARRKKGSDRELFLAGWDAFTAELSKHT